MLLPLLTTFSWQELRQHPWRNAAAVVSVMLGVALAFAVHLINASALDEFSQAVRSVGGQPDLELRTAAGSASSVDLALWGQLLQHPDVAVAAALLPLPAANADRLAFFAPDTVFLNPLARQALPGATVQLQHGLGLHTLQVAGSVAAGGAPLAVMDIAAVQSLFGRSDLSRVDVRLRAGVDRAQFVRDVTEAADWPAGATLRPNR